MILRVDIRGDGSQLGPYMHRRNENDYTEILEVDGREDATPEYLEQIIMSMEFNAELTKSPDKPFFHAQINPAYGEDKAMTREDWYLAADILAKGTGYENQRRVITLHTKKGRTHAHVVWERYDHETGKMIDNKHSKYKADATRPMMEKALGHKPTQRRNPHRFALKETATEIWNRTSTGAEFIKEARKAGYMVASGTGNRPFMIVDGNGISYDLVRQLDGVRTKEVRARLRHEPLVTDKQAIELMREQGNNSKGREKQKLTYEPPITPEQRAQQFADNRGDTVPLSRDELNKRRVNVAHIAFGDQKEDIAAKQAIEDDTEQRKHEAAKGFSENKTSGIDQKAQQAIERQKIIAEQERIKKRNLERKRHR